MISDEAFLEAVNRLRDEWAVLLGNERAATLEQCMAGTAFDDAESMRQTAGQVLKLAAERPEFELRVESELGIRGDLALALRMYEPMAGEGNAYRPGPMVVCPIDPGHLRTRLRHKGQMCPVHHVELVPEDQAKPKE